RRAAPREPSRVLLPLPRAERPRRVDRPDQPGLPARRAALPDGSLGSRPGGGDLGPGARSRTGGAGALEAPARGGRRAREPGIPATGPTTAPRCSRRELRNEPALHVGNDGPPEGLRAEQPLLPERRRLVSRPRRKAPDRARHGAVPQPAAALPHERAGGDRDVRDPDRER